MTTKAELAQARFQTPLPNGRIQCTLCPHCCQLDAGQAGRCRVRVNTGGSLRTLSYGYPVALAVDPIEKKPLFHVRPGARTLSYATSGCNLTCRFCQNHTISRAPAARSSKGFTRPEDVALLARKENAEFVAHTYTEPTIYFEYATDIAAAALEYGIRSILVTNGFTFDKTVEAFGSCVAAVNVDLKAFQDRTYREIMGGHLAPVLESIRLYHSLGVWVEVTTLVVTGMNDSAPELTAIAEFVASVSPDIPWHVSRFFPSHEMQHLPPTPMDRIETAIAAGKAAGLRFVYSGNLGPDHCSTTRCPECQAAVVERLGYCVRSASATGTCPACGCCLPGLW